MKNNKISLEKRKLIKRVLIALAWCGVTYGMGYLPNDDLYQGIFVGVSGIIVAVRRYRKNVKDQGFEERHEDRGKVLAEIWSKNYPYDVSNILESVNMPRWQTIEIFWEKIADELCIFSDVESICKHLNRLIPKNPDIEFLKYTVIRRHLQYFYMVNVLCKNGDRPGRKIDRYRKWAEQNRILDTNIDISFIDSQLKRIGQEATKTLEPIAGTQGAYSAHIGVGDPALWSLTMCKEMGVDLLFTTYDSITISKDGKSTTTKKSIRLGFSKALFSQQLGKRIREECPLFDKQNGAAIPAYNHSGHMMGMFIQEKQDISEEQIDEVRKYVEKLARELCPAPKEKAVK